MEMYMSLLIAEDPTVTVKCRSATKALFLYLHLCLHVIFNNLSYSLTSLGLFSY